MPSIERQYQHNRNKEIGNLKEKYTVTIDTFEILLGTYFIYEVKHVGWVFDVILSKWISNLVGRMSSLVMTIYSRYDQTYMYKPDREKMLRMIV